MSATTAVAQTTSGTVSTTASTAGTSSQLGLCLTNPTTSAYGIGTGIKAAFLVAAPILVTGAVVGGIALLSYAVTKAALEP